jgi:hypothetical protein
MRGRKIGTRHEYERMRVSYVLRKVRGSAQEKEMCTLFKGMHINGESKPKNKLPK